LESGEAKDFVIKRESEIEEAERHIQKIEEDSKRSEEQVQTEIDELTHGLQEIKEKIEKSRIKKERIVAEAKERVLQIWQEIGFQQPPDYIPHSSKYEVTEPRPSKEDKSYTTTDLRYLNMLNNPNTLPSKIKVYIDDVGEVTFAKLKRTCVEQFGCKSEISGSIGASVNILRKEGHLKTEGWGDGKRIISLKKT